AANRHICTFDLDFDIRINFSSTWGTLSNEILNDKCVYLDGSLHWEVRVDDLHLVLKSFSHTFDHVAQVGSKGTDHGLVLYFREFAADDEVVTVKGDFGLGIEEISFQFALGSGNSYDRCLTDG